MRGYVAVAKHEGGQLPNYGSRSTIHHFLPYFVRRYLTPMSACIPSHGIRIRIDNLPLWPSETSTQEAHSDTHSRRTAIFEFNRKFEYRVGFERHRILRTDHGSIPVLPYIKTPLPKATPAGSTPGEQQELNDLVG